MPASQPEPGEIVDISLEKMAGLLVLGSLIRIAAFRVRLLTWKPDERIDDEFFRRRASIEPFLLRTQLSPSRTTNPCV